MSNIKYYGAGGDGFRFNKTYNVLKAVNSLGKSIDPHVPTTEDETRRFARFIAEVEALEKKLFYTPTIDQDMPDEEMISKDNAEVSLKTELEKFKSQSFITDMDFWNKFFTVNNGQNTFGLKMFFYKKGADKKYDEFSTGFELERSGFEGVKGKVLIIDTDDSEKKDALHIVADKFPNIFQNKKQIEDLLEEKFGTKLKTNLRRQVSGNDVFFAMRFDEGGTKMEDQAPPPPETKKIQWDPNAFSLEIDRIRENQVMVYTNEKGERKDFAEMINKARSNQYDEANVALIKQWLKNLKLKLAKITKRHLQELTFKSSVLKQVDGVENTGNLVIVATKEGQKETFKYDTEKHPEIAHCIANKDSNELLKEMLNVKVEMDKEQSVVVSENTSITGRIDPDSQEESTIVFKDSLGVITPFKAKSEVGFEINENVLVLVNDETDYIEKKIQRIIVNGPLLQSQYNTVNYQTHFIGLQMYHNYHRAMDALDDDIKPYGLKNGVKIQMALGENVCKLVKKLKIVDGNLKSSIKVVINPSPNLISFFSKNGTDKVDFVAQLKENKERRLCNGEEYKKYRNEKTKKKILIKWELNQWWNFNGQVLTREIFLKDSTNVLFLLKYDTTNKETPYSMTPADSLILDMWNKAIIDAKVYSPPDKKVLLGTGLSTISEKTMDELVDAISKRFKKRIEEGSFAGNYNRFIKKFNFESPLDVLGEVEGITIFKVPLKREVYSIRVKGTTTLTFGDTNLFLTTDSGSYSIQTSSPTNVLHIIETEFNKKLNDSKKPSSVNISSSEIVKNWYENTSDDTKIVFFDNPKGGNKEIFTMWKSKKEPGYVIVYQGGRLAKIDKFESFYKSIGNDIEKGNYRIQIVQNAQNPNNVSKGFAIQWVTRKDTSTDLILNIRDQKRNTNVLKTFTIGENGNVRSTEGNVYTDEQINNFLDRANIIDIKATKDNYKM